MPWIIYTFLPYQNFSLCNPFYIQNKRPSCKFVKLNEIQTFIGAFYLISQIFKSVSHFAWKPINLFCVFNFWPNVLTYWKNLIKFSIKTQSDTKIRLDLIKILLNSFKISSRVTVSLTHYYRRRLCDLFLTDTFLSPFAFPH